jgi:hypothetical protein
MFDKDQFKYILADQRAAILNKPAGIERALLSDIDKTIDLPHVVVITGLRRVGKSTLMRQIIQKYYNDERFYYINFEDERLFRFQAGDFNLLYEALIELYGEQKTFFIDEIQNVEHFENFVRRFYDTGFKFFITGSNANLLSREISTKLTGRHFDMIVRPFSFREYLSMQNVIFEKEMLYNTVERTRIKAHFRDYLVSGGMPEFLLYKEPEILSRIYEDIIIKDIAVRYNVANIFEMRDIFLYLITNTANKFSFNKLKTVSDIGSITTIKNYIHYLAETFFINVIKKFDYSLKKQLVNDKKAYVIDNGFYNVLSTKMTTDIGWLLENLVGNVLSEAGQLYYFSDKSECDFVIQKDNQVTTAIQVTNAISEANEKREYSGLLGAMKTFNLKEGIILTNDQESISEIDRKTINVIPVWKWLLN